MNTLLSRFRNTRHAAVAASVLLCSISLTAGAQVVLAPGAPQVGSSNPVSSEPGVKRPSSTPCIVPLFTNQGFNDFNTKHFSYTPPAACRGPWSKVVFTGDFTVTAGRQFDRTAQFFIGGTIVYFGTTAEPRRVLSPSWHVERDVTDLSALFTTAQPGVASLGNFVGTSGGVTYDGLIYANAALEFYPADITNPAPKTPDVVLPLPGDGTAFTLNKSSDVLARTFTFPRNIENVYLDVIAQSQGGDEFWYTCSPSDVATELANCGNTAFRETEISIDGKPAGIAPIYPWIYTGGLDPYLWEPTVGVQTLDFKPFRVDLTPFAGMLSDGNQHTVGVSVYKANGYFAATATLLLGLDHGSAQTTGEVTNNSVPAASGPYVQNHYKTDALGGIAGTSLVSQQHNFNLSGYVNTSHGRVETSIDETVAFGNYQTIVNDSSQYKQTLEQASGAYAVTRTKEGLLTFERDHLAVYPLTLDYNYSVASDGSQSIASRVVQRDYDSEKDLLEGFTYYTRDGDETVNSNDTLQYNAAGSFTGHTGSSNASDTEKDSLGSCWSRELSSSTAILTSVIDGAACGVRNQK